MKRFLAALLLAPCLAVAQSYPAKPVRMIVPFPPGGGTDVIARVTAQHLSRYWGQPVVVDNKPGASGIIGSDIVAKSVADGYTLLLQSTQHSINLNLYKQLPYDTLRDFVPVAYIAAAPFLMLVHPAVPASNVQELIAYIKTQPGGINYASSGIAGGAHLAGAMLATAAGVQFTHIPYKGGGPALADVIGGQVPLVFDPIPSSIGHVRGGRLKVIAITSAQRSALMPEVPTVAESGVPGFAVSSFFALYAPAATPKDIINKINADVNRILELPDVKEQFAALGAEPIAMTPDQFALQLRTEIAKFAKAIKDSGAKAEKPPPATLRRASNPFRLR